MRTPRTGRWARWGWLATTFAMGVALLVTSWAGYRSAQQAASTLNRGQGDVLLEAARQTLRAAAAGSEKAALDSLLADRQDAGLRYLGVYDDGAPVMQAGSPVEPVVLPDVPSRGGPPSPTTAVGSRLRLVTFVPRSRPGPPTGRPTESATADRTGDRTDDADSRRGDGRERQADRTGGRPGTSGSRQPALLVLEFEPVIAEQLTARSARTLGLALLGTIVLLAAALLFWRLSIVYEREQRTFEQQRRLGALGEMSAVLAHEIRNPLASLKGHAQLLAERLAPDSRERRKADRVVGEAKRLENLVTDLLAFTRTAPLERKPTDPARLVRAAIREVGADAFTIDDTAAPATWSLDADRIGQALINLLRNACQASPESERTGIRIAVENGRLAFSVRDHGPGLPAGDETRVFEPFYTTRTHGTGLGLAVASRIADMHDGSISAANHPDGGAVFRLEIPRS